MKDKPRIETAAVFKKPECIKYLRNSAAHDDDAEVFLKR